MVLARCNVIVEFIYFDFHLLAKSRCEEREVSGNYKMKNCCSQWDSDPKPSDYEFLALPGKPKI